MAVANVQGAGRLDIFEEAVGRGVSANVCEVMAGLLAAAGQAGRLAVEVAWALTLPSAVPESRPIELADAEVLVLNPAARVLRESSPEAGVPLASVVIRLARGQDVEDGTATLLGVVSGAIRIEHAIGGVKRDRMVKDNIRLVKDGIHDIMMETCGGLNNFRLLYRPWHYANS